MASRAERGECSVLYDGVVGARRAGELQAKRVEKKKIILRTAFGTPSALWARPSINRGTVRRQSRVTAPFLPPNPCVFSTRGTVRAKRSDSQRLFFGLTCFNSLF